MRIKDSKDIHAQFWEGGKLILVTKRSHGSGKLDGKIPHLIRQQLKLTQEQFDDLIACPLGRPEYIEVLKGKGLLGK